MTTEHEDLAQIRRLMDDAQRAVDDRGTYYLVWGAAMAIGLAATWTVVTRGLSNATLWTAWGALVATGWGLTAVLGRRAHARAPVRTLATRLLADTWTSVGIALVVIVFAGATSGAIHLSALPGLVSTTIGVGFFASASVYRAFPMRLLGAAWFTGATAMFVWRGPWTILLMAAMVIALEVVPGVVLWRRREAPDAAG